MARLDVSPDDLRELAGILARYVPHAEVLAYGSRVTGGAHAGSDLDLVVRSGGGRLDPLQFGELRSALSESHLPMLVDVHDWARIPESFRREIERAHIVVQKGRAAE